MQTPPTTSSGGSSPEPEPTLTPGGGPAYGSRGPESPYGPGPASGETRRDYERRAVDFLKERVDRREEITGERYKGLFGRITEWFDSEGKLKKGDTLDQVAEWEKNPTWKKWAKIGAKVAGGFGIAATMAFTGGVGAVLTPILWTVGMREGWDGALQLLEKGGFGRGRTQAEVARQENLNQRITELKQLVRGGEITPERFQQALDAILDSERQAMEQIETNMTSERRWKLGRAIASTVLTVGTGVITGVPLGTASYAKEATGQATHLVGHKSSIFLDESHKVFWNFRGGQFLYNSPGEFTNAAQFAAQNAAPWTHFTHFWQASHVLGHGLPKEAIAGLWGSGIYLAGRWLAEYAPDPWRKRRTGPSPGPYGPYGPPYGPYGPDGGRRPGAEGTRRWWDQPEYRQYLGWVRRGGIRLNPYERRRNPDGSYTWFDREGREVRRDVERERAAIEEYFGRHGRGYRRELLGEIKKQRLPEMAQKCRVAVVIPAYHEEANIYHALEEYSKQVDEAGNPLDPELYEINVIVNRGQKDKADKTIDEVRRFQHEHPGVKVVVVDKVFPERNKGVGMARKFMTDLVLKRSVLREIQDGCLYIESEDADLIKVDPKTVINLIKKLDTEQHLDCVRGTQERLTDRMKDNDLALLERRAWDFLENFMRGRRYRPEKTDYWSFHWNRKITSGWNTAYTAEAYALIGGYNGNLKLAEDTDIGMKISMLRGREVAGRIRPNIDTVGTIKTRSTASPRRFLSAMVSGFSPYGEFTNPEIDEEIRNADEAELLRRLDGWKRISPDNKRKFEDILSSDYNLMVQHSGQTRENCDRVFRRTMTWLGFAEGDYNFEGNSVVINNTENFAHTCESYRTLGPGKARVYNLALNEGLDPVKLNAELETRGITSRDFRGLPDAEKDNIRTAAAA